MRRSLLRALEVLGCAVALTFALSAGALANDHGPSQEGDHPGSSGDGHGRSRFTLAVGGDVACAPGNPVTPRTCQQAGTARLIESLNPDGVAIPGDIQYEHGSLPDFMASFDPTWGAFKAKIFPAAGNHEYYTPGGAGYYDYFNGVGRPTGPAGDRDKGYYSADLGRWHLITLNSNCGFDPYAPTPISVPCNTGSPQERWLRADLQAHRHQCIVAQWHHPLYSSGPNGVMDPNDEATRPFWRDLYAYHATLVLNGHDHNYERFAPQNADAQLDPRHGVREFVVGTGGKSLFEPKSAAPNSEVFNNNTFGVMVLTLRPSGYDWRFVAEPLSSNPGNGTFTDQGSARCNGRGGAAAATRAMGTTGRTQEAPARTDMARRLSRGNVRVSP